MSNGFNAVWLLEKKKKKKKERKRAERMDTEFLIFEIASTKLHLFLVRFH